ncbi:unnamed protein product [Rotaria socialis]|uniref:Uncharacterized protein n=1 Tax=Rotaria socialis TaxID=392032 RepID=A0A820XL25_9BILA|nr:unnamed protein product [Rotaria socialis]CAF4534887.1 unnamed protein product [Rotaria socialis]
MFEVINFLFLLNKSYSDLPKFILKTDPLTGMGVNVNAQNTLSLIPLDNFFAASPQTDVGPYALVATKTRKLPVGTMMVPRQTVRTLSSYNNDSASRLVGNDIRSYMSRNELERRLIN